MTHLDRPILSQAVRYILDGPHLSVLATIDADGIPQTSVIFVKRDGDDILFSTIKGGRKTINMSRDPRVNLLINGLPVDRPNYAGDGPNYATISGAAELTDDPNGAFHQEMYDIHIGGATLLPEPGAQRMIVRIVAHRLYIPTFPAPSNPAERAAKHQAHDPQTVESRSLRAARVIVHQEATPNARPRLAR
jgi:PPOX class probable F420-dependent enzyme